MRPTLRMWNNRLTSAFTQASGVGRGFLSIAKLFYIVPLRVGTLFFQLLFSPIGLLIGICAPFIWFMGALWIAEHERNEAVRKLLEPTPIVIKKTDQIPDAKGKVKGIPSPSPKPFDAAAEPSDISYILENLGYEDSPAFKTCVLSKVDAAITKSAELFTMGKLNGIRDVCMKVESNRRVMEAQRIERQQAEAKNKKMKSFIEEQKRNL